MRLRNYLVPVFILLSCFGSDLWAQSQLGFGAATLNKDTLNIGDTLFITSYVHNFDTVAYTNFISFGLKINGVQNVNQVLFPNPYYDQVITINPGDSIIAKMKIIITSAYFEIGPDILVVWPIAHDGSPPIFSIDTQIIVRDMGVGIKDLEGAPELKAYYADMFIHLKARSATTTINHVTIYDLGGREVLHQITDGNHPIPFGNESSGIYFIAINFNEGETCVYRIVK
jgi:hypothetical protein